MRRILPLVLGLVLTGCKGNQPPLLGKIADQRALVNQELVLRIEGRDTDGDPLTWVAESGSLAALGGRSRFDADRKGATFIWTPLASDIGVHDITVGLSDGEVVTKRSFQVAVDAGEGSTEPAFVQPLGTGGTLDLARQACLELPIVVTDPDTPGVTLGQAEPLIQGAALAQKTELEGTWSWCPTREQVSAAERYTLRLTADDYDNPTVVKDYLVVLRGGDGSDCPGEAPVVRHTPQDWSWLSEVRIEATVSDDQGLKFEPLLYYTLSDPGDEPDISQMIQVTMELQSGSMKSGDWVATLPNPVADGRVGDREDIWYLISASDNDDAEGLCDHVTASPSEGVHRIEVENTGEGGGGGEVCEPCSSDVQCGGADDLCVNFSGGYHCFQDCDDDDDCPSGHYCSFSTFTSIGGEQGRQCLPDSLSCDDDGIADDGGCDDDGYEENDYSWEATYLPEGTYGLMSCPDPWGGSDDDWFEFDVVGDQQVEAMLDGGNASDLDLLLLDSTGAVLDRGETLSSFEVVEACVPTGTYRLRVLAYGAAENPYDLDLDIRPGNCPGSCDDDSYEPDDTQSSATYADLDLGTYHAWSRQVCADDDDWYEVYLFAGEELHATLDFVQTTADQDLDLWFVGYDGTNYSDCFEWDASGCDALNGQSGNSDERMAWSINVEDTYYVVVHGWDGSENAYDLCIGLDEWDCP